ncbi:membrane protease YdiL (CAAX protease family) [Dysgonomonas sp. PH5-45]|uniref:CPBP family intramembrane glutamic endopeptidase n=1 Tax=unclassified Dysgonomonas TaxID=2630389 RepID=UPI0024765B40|nr:MULTISPECIES: type II CAAX endopeptidase family protein [unclassified Dysgonomonas]MDH6354521.1 membrane protease YdiL (CAAX protease family) [Dysgonomonas sp. PH5-45]MDH6387423.1 membrane protease YdiL (CAAX protease family) [Dysgonomonas sp. PH5-37]
MMNTSTSAQQPTGESPKKKLHVSLLLVAGFVFVASFAMGIAQLMGLGLGHLLGLGTLGKNFIEEVMVTSTGGLNLEMQTLSTVFSVAGVLGVIYLFWCVIEQKKIKDLGFALKGHKWDFVWGSLFATGLMLLGFGILLAMGQIEVVSVQVNVGSLLLALLMFAAVSFNEEIICRGYMLGMLMGSTNRFAALAISSFVFATMHAFNPNMGFLPMLNLFIAGLMLGVTYIYTRNLWFPIGLHLFWNFVQGPVCGYNVSGTLTESVFKLKYPTQNAINGGSFGFEGSVVCSLIMLVFVASVIFYYERKKSPERI